jgi:hypothetical protein
MLFRIYTVFYILLYLFLTFSPDMLKLYGIWEFVDMAVMFTALAGMVAYGFIIKLLAKKFWEYFFYLFIIYELVYMAWLQLPLLEKLDLLDRVAMSNLVNLLMMLPVAFALFRLQQQWEERFPPGREGTHTPELQ